MGEKMKEVFKLGASLFGKLILVGVMCFFIVISISVISMGLFTENIGYKAMGVKEGSTEQVELYEHYFADGDDTKKKEFEEQGYKVSEVSIRSELSGSGNAFFLTVTQLFSTVLLICIIYPVLWQKGTKDSNLVHFKHMPEDKLKGLKCASLAAAPQILLIIILAALSGSVTAALPTALIKFLYAPFYAFIHLICGNAATLGELSVIQLIGIVLLNLFIPLTGYVSYLLGYKNISISEKLTYKKNDSKI